MSIVEIDVCRQLIIILFEGPSLQPYCMLITITLNDAHSTCVAMCISNVSTRTLNCVVFSISQLSFTPRVVPVVMSVLKGISVNGHVQHLVFIVNNYYLSRGRCTVR